MKRWIAIASLLFASVAHAQEPTPTPDPTWAPAPQQSGSFADGMLRGQQAANSAPAFGWGVGGLGGGFCLGCIGCLAVTGVAAVVDPAPPHHLMVGSSGGDYQLGFSQGYQKRLKTRRTTSAFVGGTIGTIIGAAIYIAVTNQQRNEEQQQQALPVIRF